MIARRVVVLPTPFLPKSAAHSPAFTVSVTPCRMCSLPMWTCTSSRLSTGGILDVVLVLLAAEIGLAHALVGSDLCRAAAREDGALRHHGDIVGDLAHHVHVVLDNDDMNLTRRLPDSFDRAAGFSRAHAASGLVKEEE